MRVACADEHCEADDGEGGGEHVAETALARAVGDVADEDCHGGGDGVRGHGEELEFGAFVAHAAEDGGEEEGEGVEGTEVAHVPVTRNCHVSDFSFCPLFREAIVVLRVCVRAYMRA